MATRSLFPDATLDISILYSSFWISWNWRTAIFKTPWHQQYHFNANLWGGSSRSLWTASCSILSNFVNLDRQHYMKKDISKVETKYMLWCLLLIYCKQGYAACFDFYLGRHQASSMKYELSYMNLFAIIWIHIMQILWLWLLANMSKKNINKIK